MKKLLIIILGICLCSSPAYGDELDPKLSTIGNEQIRVHTRAMINAGIPGDEAIKMTRLMTQNNYKDQNILRAQKILIDTVREGLPDKPVMNKAYEGIAKNVQEDRVVGAMEKTRTRYSVAYRHARSITQNPVRVNDIGKTIAEGLTAGINNKDAYQIMESLQNSTRQMTRNNTEAFAEEIFLSLRDMARRSVLSKIATDVVSKALEHEYSVEEIKQMRHSFISRSMNFDPTILAIQYGHDIEHGVRAKDLNNRQRGKSAPFGKDSGHSGSGSFGGGSGGAGGDGSGGAGGGSGGAGGGGSGGTGGDGSGRAGGGGSGGAGGSGSSGGGRGK
ncbi:MAG: hypothetical protein OET57_20940 [Desulfobacteraceae bacterium]|nr:hypothetical protein [Desulfobacteraceae bacterium]